MIADAQDALDAQQEVHDAVRDYTAIDDAETEDM